MSTDEAKTNWDGYPVHLGDPDKLGGDTGLSASQVYYCGRQVLACRCGKCVSGRCGPDHGCPCFSCLQLVQIKKTSKLNVQINLQAKNPVPIFNEPISNGFVFQDCAKSSSPELETSQSKCQDQITFDSKQNTPIINQNPKSPKLDPPFPIQNTDLGRFTFNPMFKFDDITSDIQENKLSEELKPSIKLQPLCFVCHGKPISASVIHINEGTESHSCGCLECLIDLQKRRDGCPQCGEGILRIETP